MTPEHENDLMLARILGVSDETASALLDRRVAITHGDGAAAALANEVADLLGRTIRIAAPDEQADVELVIGSAAAGRARVVLFMSLSEESVTIRSDGISNIADCHGLLRCVAACYAASATLCRALGLTGLMCPDAPLAVSFSDLFITPELLEAQVSLRDTCLVGAGAIGNGFLRALRHISVNGELIIADPKRVGAGNPNRCFYFGAASVGKEKALDLCLKAQPGFKNLRLEPFVGDFKHLIKERGRITRAIVGVDSRRMRRSIQKELPLEVFDASTTAAEEIVVHSNHYPMDGACLACIYRHVPMEHERERDIAVGLGVSLADVERGFIDEAMARKILQRHSGLDRTGLVGMSFDSLFKELCSQQALSLPGGEQVLAPFAFVSALAGALLVVELIRVLQDGSNASNYFFTNPWRSPNKGAHVRRPRVPECEFCSDPDLDQAMHSVWKDVLSTPAR